MSRAIQLQHEVNLRDQEVSINIDLVYQSEHFSIYRYILDKYEPQ